MYTGLSTATSSNIGSSGSSNGSTPGISIIAEAGCQESKQNYQEMPDTYKDLMRQCQKKFGVYTIDSFEMLKVIGKGAYGKVTLVRKKLTDAVYAMKILKKVHLQNHDQVQRTKTERKILEKIDHPYVIKMHYAFQSEKKLYMVLDYCPGGQLFFHLQNCKRFNESTARFFASNIVLALEHLHENDIVYRDLKPQNVLIDRRGFAILTDFGLSKEQIKGDKKTKSICGTPQYLAPEVLNQDGYGKAVDWWSLGESNFSFKQTLGCLIYQMLIGLPPYYEQSRKKLLHKIKHEQCKIPTGLGMEATDIILGLLQKDPSKRLGNRAFGIQEIKAHPWFNGVQWDKLLEKKVRPPFEPQLKGDDDSTLISPEFTNMPIISPDTQGSVHATGTYGSFYYDVDGLSKQKQSYDQKQDFKMVQD